MDVENFLKSLKRGETAERLADPGAAREIVVDRKTGVARQAGATTPEGKFVTRFKQNAERSLYAFSKGVLKQDWLTPTLHKPICDWLIHTPPRRKLLLLSREHGKTSLVSHSLPLHILMQPAESNIYIPGMDGALCRILLACETEGRALDHMRVLQSHLMNNEILRAFWPHRVWDNPRKEAGKWTEREMILPRTHEYPDPSIRGIGVGGAITGAHPNVLIKDDLCTLDAANSPPLMKTVIDWHVASRALIAGQSDAVEWIIGTLWSANDLYAYVKVNDPTVEVLSMGCWADQAQSIPVYPEKFSRETLNELQRQYGPLFSLLYLNDPTDTSLVDFNTDYLREYQVEDGFVLFDTDERDIRLRNKMSSPDHDPIEDVHSLRDLFDGTDHRREYFRLRS